MVNFDVTIDGARVVVRGEIDTHTAPLLADALAGLDSTTHATLDLSNTVFISSAGLSVILDAQRRLTERGGALNASNPQSVVARTIELAGLSEKLGLR